MSVVIVNGSEMDAKDEEVQTLKLLKFCLAFCTMGKIVVDIVDKLLNSVWKFFTRM